MATAVPRSDDPGAGRFAAVLALTVGMTLAFPVAGHVSRIGSRPVAGVPIAEITHGQMPVIAAHAGAILTLAARQPNPGADFARVRNHARIQRAACLWGLVPGSISDEASPFNACSHAHLAALRDLMLRMATDPVNGAAKALVHRIDLDMMQARTSLSLCNFSAIPFDTATVVHPARSDVPGHPASLATSLAVLALAGSAVAGFLRWLRSPVAV